jgi:hypothetical protein
LKSIFDYLRNKYCINEEKEFILAIPLNEFIFRLKEVSTPLYIVNENNIDIIEELDIDSIINRSLKIVYQRVKSYVDKKKLTPKEEIIFRKTLLDVVTDLKDGGLNKKLHMYLMRNYDGLTMETYIEKYQYKFEYFVRFLKNIIALQLKK